MKSVFGGIVASLKDDLHNYSKWDVTLLQALFDYIDVLVEENELLRRRSHDLANEVTVLRTRIDLDGPPTSPF